MEELSMAEIIHKIKYIHQSGPMDCWAAALAMILGRSIVVDQVFLSGGGLTATDANIMMFAEYYGLKLLPMGTYTVDGLAKILKSGPIFVGGKFNTAHAYAIAGIKGNQILVHDPATKAGWISYSTLVSRYPFSMAILMQKK
jgi:ABC-type bacteriocin/lantibiotic exporter with double-glycine peptidase domain